MSTAELIYLSTPSGPSPWAKFYEGREGHEYQRYVEQRYAPYIAAINDRIQHNNLVLELGCGTGTISHSLADYCQRHNVKYLATDIDPAMVDIAKSRLWDLDVSVFRMDALAEHPALADVVHSHGMLEHFDDETIRKIISKYRFAAQVHYVPGLYEAPTFGDERLMSVDAWWKLCKPDQIITFNEGLDYALIFERK
jgi:SAM-dependent methyltransferase